MSFPLERYLAGLIPPEEAAALLTILQQHGLEEAIDLAMLDAAMQEEALGDAIWLGPSLQKVVSAAASLKDGWAAVVSRSAQRCAHEGNLSYAASGLIRSTTKRAEGVSSSPPLASPSLRMATFNGDASWSQSSMEHGGGPGASASGASTARKLVAPSAPLLPTSGVQASRHVGIGAGGPGASALGGIICSASVLPTAATHVARPVGMRADGSWALARGGIRDPVADGFPLLPTAGALASRPVGTGGGRGIKRKLYGASRGGGRETPVS